MDSGPHDPNLLHSGHPATHLIHVKPSLRATNDSFREPGWVPARISSKLIHSATGAKPHPSTTVFMESGASPKRVSCLPFTAPFVSPRGFPQRPTDADQPTRIQPDPLPPRRPGRPGSSSTISRPMALNSSPSVSPTRSP